MPKPHKLDWLQPAVLTGSLLPLALMLYQGLSGSLGANPIATALNRLGMLTLLFLLASLSCTPIKIVFGAKWPLRLRKTLGLLAFWCALAHFLVYAVFDQVLMLEAIVEDIAERPFILLGALGLSAWVGGLDYVLLPALAIFLGLTVYGLWRRNRAATCCDSKHSNER